MVFQRFYEGLKGLRKTFLDTTKKCENNNLSFLLIEFSEMHMTGRTDMKIWDKTYFIKCGVDNLIVS